MRMNLPGTLPPKVQNTYSTPSASRLVTSCTSKLTMTLVGFFRVSAGGTLGASVNTAVSTPTTSGSCGFVAAGEGASAAIAAAATVNQRPATPAPILFNTAVFARSPLNPVQLFLKLMSQI